MRLADLFLLHLEIVCLCCAFLKALDYLRVGLVDTIQHIQFLVSSVSDTRNTRQRSQFVQEYHHDSRTKEHDDGAASEIFIPHLGYHPGEYDVVAEHRFLALSQVTKPVWHFQDATPQAPESSSGS